MWNNPLFEQLSKLQDNIFWKQRGIVVLEQVYESETMWFFDSLKTQYNLSYRNVYKLLQLRHALQDQFGSQNVSISKFPPIGV